MNTALIATGTASARPAGHETLIERISRLVRPAPVEQSREQLAELHERQREAARLREERFRDVAVSRLV
ncbi:hypothetical protein [Agromyces albus]|uniref:Uncharacterized protein n=1 Tax=Agromyces albus TaxID=205332 RepID=A0A4Q2L8K3_9MICO|nr:hypothetical protein [Agromyces albus]RXZ72701.1 hypothetical protein ESP51_02550 [Agromyces albus]